jgi:hypothetical protein
LKVVFFLLFLKTTQKRMLGVQKIISIIVKLELGINTSGFRKNAWASGIILSTKMSKLSSVTLKEIHKECWECKKLFHGIIISHWYVQHSTK